MSDSTDVAVRHQAPATLISDSEIDRTWRLAKALSASSFFKDARQAEQAFAKMLLGRDLGLSPTQAMTSIHIVEGKPELSANLQATLVRSAPGYDYRVTEHTDEACEIQFLRGGEEVGRERFSMEDAKRAGLATKNVWKSYPRNMLFARAMSNGVAFHCPEVTGGVRVYSEGELSGYDEPSDAPSSAGAPQAHVSDVPSDLPWEAPPAPSEPEADPEPAQAFNPVTGRFDEARERLQAEEVSGEVVAELVDERFASDIFEELKRRQVTVGQFRALLAGVGAEVPADLRSAEARLAALGGLSVVQGVDLSKLVGSLPEAAAA